MSDESAPAVDRPDDEPGLDFFGDAAERQATIEQSVFRSVDQGAVLDRLAIGSDGDDDAFFEAAVGEGAAPRSIEVGVRTVIGSGAAPTRAEAGTELPRTTCAALEDDVEARWRFVLEGPASLDRP